MTAAPAKRFRASTPLHERFLVKVNMPEEPDACWLWTAGVAKKTGYGRINEGPPDFRVVLAHRVSYELFIGPIPDGMQVDHRCHSRDPNCVDWDGCPHRRCVNPAHLEALPVADHAVRSHNLKMLTAVTGVCQRGHDYNLHVYTHPKTGKSQCQECRRWRRARGAA